MYFLKQLLQFVRTRGALTAILFFSVYIFLLLVKKYDLALITHNTDTGFDELLTVVIGVLVTLIVTTFSAVVVALQLASGQFSPRILRGFFSEDWKVQFFLMSYFLCISYCLTIKFLGLVHVQNTIRVLGFTLHYASIGITMGILLVLVVFPIFIYYIIKNINVSYIIYKISRRTIREINLLFEKEWKPGMIDSYSQPYPADKDTYLEIKSVKHGFLDNLNPVIFEIVKYFGHKIYIAEFVGGFISKGSVIAYVDYKGDNALRKKILSFLLNKAIHVNHFRSYTQDVNFGIRQLVDIAIKAISPAVNDPTTAINCTNYLGEILKEYVTCKFPARSTQEFNKINVFVNEFNFDKLVDQAFDQIYFWGSKDYLIVRHLVYIITQIVEVNKNPNNLAVLVQQVIDMELLDKDKSQLKKIFGYDEYVNSLNKNFIRKFVSKSLRAIDSSLAVIENAPHKEMYAQSQAQLAKQKIILSGWESNFPV